LRSLDTPPRSKTPASAAGTTAVGSPEIAIWLLIDLNPAVSFRSDAIRRGVLAFVANPRPTAASNQAFAQV
jgi:hypothetical protein